MKADLIKKEGKYYFYWELQTESGTIFQCQEMNLEFEENIKEELKKIICKYKK